MCFRWMVVSAAGGKRACRCLTGCGKSLKGSAIAAHTAISKKLELFNNFPRVKHARIFETVKLTQQSEQPDPLTIQKLISGPVLHPQDRGLGVLKGGRKGFGLLSPRPRSTLHSL